MSLATGFRARAMPVLLGIFLAGGSLADCMVAVEGAAVEMPCCPSKHHDTSCPLATKTAKVAPCCENGQNGQFQQANGFVVAKEQRITAPTAIPFSTVVVAALPAAPVRARLVSSTDTGPPFSPTRRHIVLSVYLI